MRSVLITRPQPVAELLAKKLEEEGFSAYLSPMMEYVPLEGALDDIDSFQALIFTSSQAVTSFAERTDDRRFIVLAVGDATAAAAARAGFSRVFSAKGDSGDMVRLIRDKASGLNLSRILHICSDDTPNYIGAAAAQLGVEVVRRPLYKARLLDSFTDETARVLRQRGIDAVVFFSARAAERFVSLMQKEGLESGNSGLAAICISPRVAAYLKDVAWLKLHIANHPSLEAVLDILRARKISAPIAAPMPTEKVILAFNGIMPMSQALNVTTDTIQTWKKKGIIPLDRVDEVLRACAMRGIEARSLWGANTAINGKKDTGPHPMSDRRGSLDRRKKSANFNHQHLVDEPGYRGIDRRSGIDRRAHAQRQRIVVQQEKMKIFDRTVLVFTGLFIVTVLAGFFLMAPEYASLQNLKPIPAQASAPLTSSSGPFGALFNKGAEQENTTVSSFAIDASRRNAQGLFIALQNAADLGRTPQGHAALEQIQQKIRQALHDSSGNFQALSEALSEAKAQDQTMSSLFGDLKGRDLAAAALLLLLNEFRANIDSSRPYVADLAALQRFFRGDPEMTRALQKLAPYAKVGAVGRETLQLELQILADNILAGSNAPSANTGQIDQHAHPQDIKGTEPGAVIARAQALLSQGDVEGARRELQSLQGDSARKIEPWMNDAANNIAASQAFNALAQGVADSIVSNVPSPAQSLMRRLKTALFGGSGAVPILSPSMQKGGSGYEGVIAP